jgi:hypothetical protein
MCRPMRSLLLLIALLAGACGSRAEGPGSSPSGAATESATATPASSTTSAPSPSPTKKPNPTAGPGTYTSTALAYRVELPAGWRRSACQSTKDPVADAVETFTTASVDDEAGTDTGPNNDVVVVRVEAAPAGQTALQWLESGKMGFFSGTRFERATIDGKDAARMVAIDTGKSLSFVVAARGRMYAVSRGLREPTPASDQAATALMTSLHVLSDSELADARATLATPTPAPVRSAEEVADAIARGFAQKDTTVLASVADDCLTSALENAGAGFSSQMKFLATLRTAFANGLAVTVQPRPVEFASGSTVSGGTIRGTWQDPGQPQRNVKFMLQKIGNTWFWIGVLYLQG